MPYANINGIKLNYEIRGTGPKLLFINGIGADLKNPISLFNSPMIEKYTILAFDSRGLGESDGAETTYSIADLADDAATLAKAVGWNKYHVFGASMGGMVAQELAIRYQNNVEKLVLAVTHSGGENGAPNLVDKLLDFSPIEILKISDTRQDEAWAAVHPEIMEKMASQSKATKALMEAKPSFKYGYTNQVKAVIGHDTTDRLHKIGAETMVINGIFDGSIPIDAAKNMADKIENSRFELISHGHGSWFYDSDVWKIITDFLE